MAKARITSIRSVCSIFLLLKIIWQFRLRWYNVKLSIWCYLSLTLVKRYYQPRKVYKQQLFDPPPFHNPSSYFTKHWLKHFIKTKNIEMKEDINLLIDCKTVVKKKSLVIFRSVPPFFLFTLTFLLQNW